jgi:hypothetical protein
MEISSSLNFSVFPPPFDGDDPAIVFAAIFAADGEFGTEDSSVVVLQLTPLGFRLFADTRTTAAVATEDEVEEILDRCCRLVMAKASLSWSAVSCRKVRV